MYSGVRIIIQASFGFVRNKRSTSFGSSIIRRTLPSTTLDVPYLPTRLPPSFDIDQRSCWQLLIKSESEPVIDGLSSNLKRAAPNSCAESPSPTDAIQLYSRSSAAVSSLSHHHCFFVDFGNVNVALDSETDTFQSRASIEAWPVCANNPLLASKMCANTKARIFIECNFICKPDNVRVHRARTKKHNIETRPRKGSVCNPLL